MALSLKKLNELVGNGRFATVVFVKRSTGELRRMRFRTGVKRYLAGGDPSYDAGNRGLLVVYDLDRGDYRSIPSEGVVELRCGGRVYRFDDEGREVA